MAVAKPLHLRLFLEGIEVPVISAQVSINVNAPASAAIQVVPLDESMNLKPRTMVHLFFLDTKPVMNEKDKTRVDGLESGYRLLFSGEVVGFSYVQTAQSRATVLQCLDFSSYWDAAHATAVEYGPNGNLFTNMGSLYGGESSHFDDIVNFQSNKIISWLRQTPQTPGLKGVTGLAGGVIRMMEALGGVDRHYKGVNDFFSIAELRCKLLAQISAEENDSTAANLMAVSVFDEWLRTGLQNAGQQVTFRDMLKLLFNYVHYEVVPNPAAKFDDAQKAANGEEAKSQRLRTQIIRPDCFFAAPPKCNVIFPEQYTQLSYDRMFINETTRTLMLVYNTLVGQDVLMADRILAPNIGEDTTKLTRHVGVAGYRHLMDHELHTGIIPRTEWLPNTSSFGTKPTADQLINLRGQRNSWASKIALFHFFKYRFGPRQAQLSGRFNPYIVCGFPSLIVKRPFIVEGLSQSGSALEQNYLDAVQGKASTLRAPTQLVGMVAGVNHMIDQAGGTTTISMHHVRHHLGVDDDFLNIYSQFRAKTKKRTVRVVLSRNNIPEGNLELLKLLADLTPQQANGKGDAAPSKTALEVRMAQGTRKSVDPRQAKGEGTVATEYAVTSEETDAPSQRTPELVAHGRVPGKDKCLVPSPPGAKTVKSRGVYGNITAIEVLSPETVDVPELGKRAYRAVALYEELDIPVTGSQPVEDIVRPNWFSPAYQNENIGKKIYQPFFGTDSIVDELSFSGLAEGVRRSAGKVDAVSEQGLGRSLEDIKKELSGEEAARMSLSIERSVNFVSYLYGVVKAKGLDVDEFVRSFTYRPIATFEEVLGDSDLELEVTGAQVKVRDVATADGKTRTPRLGYHSLSVHPTCVDKGNLTGLTNQPEVALPRLNGDGAADTIPGAYDVRKEKRDRVLAYVEALGRGRDVMGVGLRG